MMQNEGPQPGSQSHCEEEEEEEEVGQRPSQV